ncbi:hypothetical protein [Streptomyces sp. NBC_00272]|uniref:hypothetical protein n=1 Tax=Streptomyces sp. NBC_00272 TaxID=2975698 RepID=UPI002E293061|nr:hypothetical protein [Streptomyces sp. NBC_00272]
MLQRRRERREQLAAQQRWEAWSAMHTEPLPHPVQPEPGTLIDDFLPSDLRLPTREELAGILMPHDAPLVLDGEVRACAECGAYRKWIVASTRDGVWLRCQAGHEEVAPRLDAAWFNRTSGPITEQHASY